MINDDDQDLISFTQTLYYSHRYVSFRKEIIMNLDIEGNFLLKEFQDS